MEVACRRRGEADDDGGGVGFGWHDAVNYSVKRGLTEAGLRTVRRFSGMAPRKFCRRWGGDIPGLGGGDGNFPSMAQNIG